MEEYDVTLLELDSQNVLPAVVSADEEGDVIALTLRLGEDTFTGQAESYLEAYQALRDALLRRGYGLRCAGSRRNAVQSAMMAYVPKVYLVTCGRQALRGDTVSIWETCDLRTFPDTQAQNQFRDQWYDSLRRQEG